MQETQTRIETCVKTEIESHAAVLHLSNDIYPCLEIFFEGFKNIFCHSSIFIPQLLQCWLGWLPPAICVGSRDSSAASAGPGRAGQR